MFETRAMAPSYDLVIRGGTCVLHRGLARVDLGVLDGRIAKIGEIGDTDLTRATRVLDARGLHVLPGVIDTQVHLFAPGQESTGTRAAIVGGVTSVLELPDTHPPTIGPAALEHKISRARAHSWCDFACFLAASPEVDAHARLERLPGCAGLTVYMSGAPHPMLVDDDEQLLRVVGRGHRRVSVRAEDEPRSHARVSLVEAEAEPHPRATQRLLALARRAGRRVHLMRLASAGASALAAQHRDLATTAATVHHLTLAAGDCYARLGARARALPPLLDEAQRAALWQAIADGVLDMIASDHIPPLADADPPERPGAGLLLPLMLEHVHAGRLGLTQLVELLATGPARVYNIARKGRIAVGLDADLTLVDLAAERELSDEAPTPYEGHRVHGWPITTLLRGHPVVRDGELLGDPSGAPLRFADTLRMVAL